MTRRGSLPEWRDVLPGLAILGALTLASALTFLMDEIQRRFAEGPRIVVLAAEAEGLQPGSTVWVAGSPSGRIVSIRFTDPSAPESSRVVIESVLLREAMPELRADATAAIGASALLAPSVLKITPGTPSAPPLASGDTIHVEPTADLERFRALADSVRLAIDLLSEDAERLRVRLAEGPGSATRFLEDPGALERLEAARARAARLAAAFRGGGGLARVARDDSLRVSLRRVVARLEELREARRAAAVPDSLAVLVEAVSRLRARSARLGEGLASARGTAGRALHDPALADRTEAAREALRALGPALIADPWRWLRIRPF